MTEIKFYTKQDKYFGFVCSGHTNYAGAGKDVICASVSSIVQAGALGIVKVLNIPAKIDKNDKIGFYNLELPAEISDKDLEDCQIILKTMYKALEDLHEGYSKYINLEEINYVY